MAAGSWTSCGGPRARLKAAADALAAEAAAMREGCLDPQGYVDVTWGAKCAEWSGKGASYVFLQDFRDWTAYCRSLADHKGIRLPSG